MKDDREFGEFVVKFFFQQLERNERIIEELIKLAALINHKKINHKKRRLIIKKLIET